MWVIKRHRKIGMNFTNLLGFFAHIAYLTLQAIPNTYTDSAFRVYDRDIRQLVQEKGLEEFKVGNQEVSLLHFNIANTKPIRDSRKPFRSYNPVYRNLNKLRGYCYAYNYTRDGCSNPECRYDHKCINCHSKDHPQQSCTAKRF